MYKSKGLVLILFSLGIVVPLITNLLNSVFFKQNSLVLTIMSCLWYSALSIWLFFGYSRIASSVKGLIGFAQKINGVEMEDNKFFEEIKDKKVKEIIVRANDGFSGKLFRISSSTAEIANIADTLDMSLKDISNVSESISDASESIAAGAASQASDVESLSTFSSDLVIKIEDMSYLSANLMGEGNKTKIASAKGIKSLEELLISNEKFGQVMKDIIAKIAALTKQADNITQVTSVISMIASQTSLLSLNASIEAARAGESGRGFAVVADEVRKLAEQSQTASKEIGSMISNVFKDLLQVKDAIDSSREVFDNQKESVEASGKAFKNIDNFINEFIDQQLSFGREFDNLNKLKNKLNESIENISAVTEESSATTQELASLTMSQTNATVSIYDIIGQLKSRVRDIIAKEDLHVADGLKSSKKRIAMLFCVEHPFFVPAIEAARKTATKYNVEIEIFSPKTQDIKEQMHMLKDIIAKGFDALAISPNDDGPEITQAMNLAVSNGMKVICFDADASKSNRLGMFETNGLSGGKVAAKITAKLLKNKGKVITNVWSDVKKSIIQDRAKGFNDEINNISGMKSVIIGLPADPSDAESEVHIRKILSDNPDVSLIYSTNLMWGLRFAKYFKKNKIDKKLITFDCDKEMGRYIEEGIVQAAITQRQFVWGEIAVKWLVDAMQGKDIPKYEDTGTYEVNKSNLKVFEKRLT